MVRQLIITCDDCGLSEGINYAAVSLHQKHASTTTSILTNFPAAIHAYDLFAQYPSLKCGVHLNLTDGYPLRKIASPSPITRADGQFIARQVLFAQALRPSLLFLELVEAELTAQIEHFIESKLTAFNLTTHMHFHIFPALRTIVYRIALKYNITRVRAHRFTSTVLPFNPLFHFGYSRARQANSLAKLQSDYLMPVLFWLGTSPEVFSRRLETLEGVIEVVVHPSTASDETFPQGVPYLPNKRFQELQYLEKALLISTL